MTQATGRRSKDDVLEQMIGLGALVHKCKHWPELEAREYRIECWRKGAQSLL